MRKLIPILLLTATSATSFAMSSGEQVHLANVYADQLLEQFDKELDQKVMFQDHTPMSLSGTYAKLLSARDFIENNDDHNGHSHGAMKEKSSILEINSAANYEMVREVIDMKAKPLEDLQEDINKARFNNTTSVIYPSTGSAGNITGNTFPKNTWAFTFDDGPRGSRTKTVVDNFYSAGKKATFFMLTAEAQKYKTTAEYVRDSGMEVALHSYTHKSLGNPSQARLNYQVTKAKKDLESLLNVKIKYFRLPYGAGTRTSSTRKTIAANKMVHLFWNIDTLDWKDKNPSSIVARAKKQMSLKSKNSGVVLFHDIHSQSVTASKTLLDSVLSRDLNVCSVGEVIDHINGTNQNCIK